jgi:DNA-directed RNA polymerase subunit beta
MDEKNAIDELAQKRKISYSNIKKENKTIQKNSSIREIHPSQLGRICPIETVEGKNAGLRISFTNEYNLTKEGFIQSPFFLRFNFIRNFKNAIKIQTYHCITILYKIS